MFPFLELEQKGRLGRRRKGGRKRQSMDHVAVPMRWARRASREEVGLTCDHEARGRPRRWCQTAGAVGHADNLRGACDSVAVGRGATGACRAEVEKESGELVR